MATIVVVWDIEDTPDGIAAARDFVRIRLDDASESADTARAYVAGRRLALALASAAAQRERERRKASPTPPTIAELRRKRAA